MFGQLIDDHHAHIDSAQAKIDEMMSTFDSSRESSKPRRPASILPPPEDLSDDGPPPALDSLRSPDTRKY